MSQQEKLLNEDKLYGSVETNQCGSLHLFYLTNFVHFCRKQPSANSYMPISEGDYRNPLNEANVLASPCKSKGTFNLVLFISGLRVSQQGLEYGRCDSYWRKVILITILAINSQDRPFQGWGVCSECGKFPRGRGLLTKIAE